MTLKKKGMKGGIASNLDVELTDAEREEENKIRDLGDAIEMGEKQTDDYHGGEIFNPDNTILTEGHTKNTYKSVRERINENIPMKPVAYIPAEDGSIERWILNDVDAQAVHEGYACQECLGWQSVPGLPYCDWKHGEGGCGFREREI